MKKPVIAPTLACADLMNVRHDVEILDRAGVGTYHVDIMDGNFVPNYCFSWDFVRQLRGITETPVDIHLMTTETDRDIDISLSVGAEAIAFHVEAKGDIRGRLERIRKGGAKCGLAISPETPVAALMEYLPDLDYVLVMGVKPGFSGQKFKEETFDRIREFSGLREKGGLSFLLYVDGGITNDIAVECVRREADLLVAGKPTIFRDKGRLKEQTEELKKALGL